MNDPENQVCPDPLADYRGTETAVPGVIGEVHIASRVELLDLVWSQKTLGEHPRVAGSEQGGVGENGLEVAVASPRGLRVTAEVDIGSPRALGVLKELIHMGNLDPVVEVLV